MEKNELLQINQDKKTKKAKRQEDKKMMNRTPKTSRRPPMNSFDRKSGGLGRGGAVSSRSFDLLNLMIYDLKRSEDLR